MPSSFLLHAIEAATGRRIGTGELARLASPGATALGRPHPEDPTRAIDRIERDLALVASGEPGAARHLAEPGGFLVRSLAQERASWDAEAHGLGRHRGPHVVARCARPPASRGPADVGERGRNLRRRARTATS